MKKAKGTIEIDGKELLQTHIDNFKKAFPDSQIYLVIGHHKVEYGHYADQVTFIENNNYYLGQFSSIQSGFSGIPNVRHSQVLLQPVDLAPIRPDVYTKLVSAPPNKEIVKPTHNKKSGHPILLRGGIIEEILTSNTDNRLDKILRAAPIMSISWTEVNCSDIYTNLNSPEELNRYIEEKI